MENISNIIEIDKYIKIWNFDNEKNLSHTTSG